MKWRDELTYIEKANPGELNIHYKAKRMFNWLENCGFTLEDVVHVDESMTGVHYRYLLPSGELDEEGIGVEDLDDDFDLDLANAKDSTGINDTETVYIDVVFINAVTNRVKVYITSEIDIDTGELELSRNTQSIETFVDDIKGVKALYKMLTGKELRVVK